ncbi:DUF928 domain-containing protein [Altericista sp. CCNU0014]|uniref:DUF928 domain-containing protein n=1 Tax=Altericista sp. CCNU0014 TaxID=3082949 RepID=UPI00384EE637
MRKSTIAPTSLWVAGLGLGLALGTALPLKASEPRRASSPKTSVLQYNPPIPPNLGAPKGRTGGGASRGTCAQYAAMQAIAPRGVGSKSPDLTVSDRPTFWFYLPARSQTDNPVEFVLQDAEDRYIYKTTFVQSKTAPELVSLTVPEQSPSLVPGTLYRWTLSIQCNPSRPSQVAFIRGAIQKVAIAPALSASLNASTLETAARLYTERGFWYDAMTVLARSMQAQPENQTTIRLWKQLLAQAGLANLKSPSIAIRRLKVLQHDNTTLSRS